MPVESSSNLARIYGLKSCLHSSYLRLTVLEGLLLHLIVPMMSPELVDIQTHIARDAPLPLGRETGLGIDDGVAALGSLYEFGVLLFEQGEVALGLPVPDAVGREEEVHLFKRALVGFGVQGPDHRDRDGVAGCEDVEGLFAQGLEHDGQKQSLTRWSAIMSKVEPYEFCMETHQPAVSN